MDKQDSDDNISATSNTEGITNTKNGHSNNYDAKRRSFITSRKASLSKRFSLVDNDPFSFAQNLRSCSETFDGSGSMRFETWSWDVKMLPVKRHMINGKLISTVRGLGSGLIQKRRRIAIEIYSARSEEEGRKLNSFLKFRGTQSKQSHSQEMQDLIKRKDYNGLLEGRNKLEDGDKIVIRILKRFGSEDVWQSFGSEQDEDGYIERERYSIDAFQILKVDGTTLELKEGTGNDTRIRNIVLFSTEEVESLLRVLEKLRAIQKDRNNRQLQNYRSNQLTNKSDKKKHLPISDSIHAGDDLHLLIEICSAIDFVGAQNLFTTVKLGEDEVHRTKPVKNDPSAVWTVTSGSLFLLSTTVKAFFSGGGGITFTVKENDQVLGYLDVKQKIFLESATGDRIEYKLAQHKVKPGTPGSKKRSKLVLRVRHATEDDVVFMDYFTGIEETKKKVGMFSNDCIVLPKLTSTSLLQRGITTRNSKDGETLYRVKPEADPNRQEETEWMTELKLIEESFKPSQNWIEAGSGDIGKVFLEVISFEEIPNMKKVGKTDAFATIVYEDAIVNTHVIQDSLSPLFPPWSQRAFIFNMMHPSSQLFLGVFDFSEGGSHDPIGRTTIDLTTLWPNIDYLMYYDLYSSALVANKRKRSGQVIVRVRVEHANLRKAFLAALDPRRPRSIINVAQKKDFACASYACIGKYNVDDFDPDILSEHIQELQHYGILIHYVSAAIFTVVLWRGHYPLTFYLPWIHRQKLQSAWEQFTRPITVLLPLHSLIAFATLTNLVENYDRLPSFLLFLVAWLLVATNGARRRHPSPWFDCKSYTELVCTFLFNRSSDKVITQFENSEAIEKFDSEQLVRTQKVTEDAAALVTNTFYKRKGWKQLRKEIKKECQLDEFEVSMGKSKKPRTLLPLKPVLYPVQRLLNHICLILRRTTRIVLWDESYEAFWLTTFCLILSILLLCVPWGFFIRWALRVIAWTLFGPHMKLVDLYFAPKLESLYGAEGQEEHYYKYLQRKLKEKKIVRTRAMVKKENVLKLGDMKKFMFGSFPVPVPRFKDARYFDRPLAESSASPSSQRVFNGDIVERKFGQHLTGDMVPLRDVQISQEH